ncbi:MAG TPA: peptide chain release factor N(5)-glutamine methyltransferase [Acidimicrobiales bacterium]|nr:peptide chain release factor N(5)-glutamine methyltransferase [Acidimicrobiales bacterium]
MLAEAAVRAADAGKPSWRSLHGEALRRLGPGCGQVARWFVEEASGGLWPGVLDDLAPEFAQCVFRTMVSRHRAGEPAQYVLGHWSFRRLDLMVDRRVLIPRPETETVVEVALAELNSLDSPFAASPIVVDLGTGSGAIALSLVAEHASAEIWATDLSEEALVVASANLAGLGPAAAGRVHFASGSWWDALPAGLAGTITLAVSNPPYVSEAEFAGLPPQIAQWEPRGALVAGQSGLEAVEAIVCTAPAWLAPCSALVVEIAPHQAAAARTLANEAGFTAVAVGADLTGLERVLVARP